MSEVVRMTAEGLLVPRAALSDLADDSGFVLRRDGRNLVLVPAEAEAVPATRQDLARLLTLVAQLPDDDTLTLADCVDEVHAYRREKRDAAGCA